MREDIVACRLLPLRHMKTTVEERRRAKERILARGRSEPTPATRIAKGHSPSTIWAAIAIALVGLSFVAASHAPMASLDVHRGAAALFDWLMPEVR